MNAKNFLGANNHISSLKIAIIECARYMVRNKIEDVANISIEPEEDAGTISIINCPEMFEFFKAKGLQPFKIDVYFSENNGGIHRHQLINSDTVNQGMINEKLPFLSYFQETGLLEAITEEVFEIIQKALDDYKKTSGYEICPTRTIVNAELIDGDIDIRQQEVSKLLEVMPGVLSQLKNAKEIEPISVPLEEMLLMPNDGRYAAAFSQLLHLFFSLAYPVMSHIQGRAIGMDTNIPEHANLMAEAKKRQQKILKKFGLVSAKAPEQG